MNTYFYKSKVLGNGIVLYITTERHRALHDAVNNCMNRFYGKKVTYCDGVTRYPWERKPYESIIETLKELPDNSKTVEFFGGFYQIVKNSLRHSAQENSLCAEMLKEIETAETDPQPRPEF